LVVSDNDFRYTGEQVDLNSGFYYLRARYMNPANGRFTQQDDFEGYSNDPRSLHKYLYVGQEPIANRDPSGRMTMTEVMIAVTVGGSLAGGGVGYYVGGTRGAVVGGVIGGVAGYMVGINALAITMGASPYIDRMLTIINTWRLPVTQWVTGPGGLKVAVSRLDSLANTPIVTLFTNLTRSPMATRALSMANTRELAAAGVRAGANYTTYVFRIPSGVIYELEKIGVLRVTQTTEANMAAKEYEFLASGAAYVMKFLEVVP